VEAFLARSRIGRVIRIGFLGTKAGRQHHWTSLAAEDREEDPRGASRSSDEMERKTSGRHAGGGYFTVEFSSDESGPEDLRLALAYGGFHIAR